MKNKSMLVVIIAMAVVLVFLFWKNNYSLPSGENTEDKNIETNETMTDSKAIEVTDPKIEVDTTTEPKSEYSYENKEFGFGVDLPGLKMTQRTEIPAYISSIFIFGVGDQSEIEEQKRIPNTMALYIWNDELEFNSMKDVGIDEGAQIVNGEKFDVYSFPNEDGVSYHYTQKRGDKIYDIGVLDKKNISKFYFLK